MNERGKPWSLDPAGEAQLLPDIQDRINYWTMLLRDPRSKVSIPQHITVGTDEGSAG